MDMRSIPTRYNNRWFRSRLEARWAVMFDSIGVEYDYELDGKILGGVTYLCDFWIPRLKAWVEIKPGKPHADEISKANRLSLGSRCKVYVFDGAIRVSQSAIYRVPEATSVWPIGPDFCGEDEGYSWCQCHQCGEFGIEFQGRSDRLSCACRKMGDRGHSTLSVALAMAYRQAMEQRFEFEDSNRPRRA